MNNQDSPELNPPSVSHSIPDNFADLVTMTTAVVGGLKTRGKFLNGIQNTAKVVQKDLTLAQTTNVDYEAGRKLLTSSLRPAFQTAQANVIKYLPQVKRVLGVNLGGEWNSGWHDAGFHNGSTKLPLAIATRKQLLLDLASYFDAHPEHESVEFSVSASRCRELHAALTSTRAAVEAHPAELKIKRTAFVKAADALRKRLRTTISELEIHLDRDSPHWGAFGLVAPAFKNRRRAKNLPAAETVAATRDSHSATGTGAGTESVALTR